MFLKHAGDASHATVPLPRGQIFHANLLATRLRASDGICVGEQQFEAGTSSGDPNLREVAQHLRNEPGNVWSAAGDSLNNPSPGLASSCRGFPGVTQGLGRGRG